MTYLFPKFQSRALWQRSRKTPYLLQKYPLFFLGNEKHDCFFFLFWKIPSLRLVMCIFCDRNPEKHFRIFSEYNLEVFSHKFSKSVNISLFHTPGYLRTPLLFSRLFECSTYVTPKNLKNTSTNKNTRSICIYSW